MPVLKIYKDGKWEDISGLSEHTHTKNDITDLQEKVYTQPNEPVDAPVGAVWVDTDEDVGFGGGSGGVSSWNDLTDKPFGVETYEAKEIIPETTLTTDENSPGMFAVPDGVLLFEIGKTYIVTYNGTEYSCVAVDGGTLMASAAGMVCIGNYALLMETGDTGEPFIAFYVPGQGTQIIDVSGALSITASVTMAGGEIIKKLDNKFLDLEWIPKTEVVTAVPEFNGDTTGFDAFALGSDNYFVKLTEQYISIDEAIGATITMNVDGNSVTEVLTSDTVVDAIDALGVSGTMIMPSLIGDVVAFSFSENVVIDALGLSFAPGTWIFKAPLFYVKSLSCISPVTKEIVVPLPEKFLGGAGGNKNSLWTPEWVPGRGETVLLPETVLKFNSNSSPPGYLTTSGSLFPDGNVPTLSVGETYIVSWNGADYPCKCMSNPDFPGWYLGTYGLSPDMLEDMRGVKQLPPFYIMNIPVEDIWQFIGYNTNDPANLVNTFGIYSAEGQMVSRMPDACLPATAARKYDIVQAYKNYRTHWTDEDGTVHQIPREYVPSEWLAAMKEGMVKFIDNCTVSMKANSNTNISNYCNFDWFPSTSAAPEELVGKIVQVTFDGTLYEYPIQRNSTLLYIGNLSLFSSTAENTGEPFGIRFRKNNVNIRSTDEEATEHTISALAPGMVPDPMPEKYLPESVQGVIIRSSTEGSTKKFMLTVNDSGTISATELT